MKHTVRKIRWWIYKAGFRPKAGSIWYSPSMSFTFDAHKAWWRK